MFNISLTAVISPLKDEMDEGRPVERRQASEPQPCRYSPHPQNRKQSVGFNNIRSLSSLILLSDNDAEESGNESDADKVLDRADVSSLSLENLHHLSFDKYGSANFDEIKHQCITAPAVVDTGVNLEVRHGLIVVKRVSKRSPLFGMLQKFDIISAINDLDMNGFTANQAENLFRAKQKGHHDLLIFRVQRENRGYKVSPGSSVASECDNADGLSDTMRKKCHRNGEIAII